MFFGDGEHFCVSGFLFFVIRLLPELDHCPKVIHFETDEPHCLSGTFDADAAEVAFAVADDLHVRRRRESGIFRKFTPRKNVTKFAFFVKVPHVLAEV